VVNLGEVKTFRIKGEIRLGFRSLFFNKEVRGLTVKEALEKVYDDIGSRNRVKRTQIKIHAVEEINPEEAKNPLIRVFAGVEKTVE